MTKETEYTLVRIPFQGFYESIHDSEIGHTLVGAITRFQAMDYSELTQEQEDEYWDVWQKHGDDIQTAYVQEYIKNYMFEVGIDDYDLDNVVIDSPRFYNFSTDRIFVKVARDELEQIREQIPTDELENSVRETYTSRPGFVSHYSNDYGAPQWQDTDKYDHNMWCTVLETWQDFDEHQIIPETFNETVDMILYQPDNE